MYHTINNIIICRYKHIYLTVITCEQFFQKYKPHYTVIVVLQFYCSIYYYVYIMIITLSLRNVILLYLEQDIRKRGTPLTLLLRFIRGPPYIYHLAIYHYYSSM